MRSKDLDQGKRLNIQNVSKRTDEEIGFDDMAAITIGDYRSVKNQVDLSNRSRDDVAIDKAFEKKIQQEDGILQNEEKIKQKREFIILLVAIIAVASIIIVHKLIEYHSELTDGKVQINYSNKDFKGMDYNTVVANLEKQGFTNVTVQAKEDLITGWIKKDGEVESVSIDGITEFSRDSRFFPEAEIIVTYHTFKAKD